jgi:hypothetical protein
VVRSTVITRGALHRGALPATRLGSVQDEVDGRLWVMTIRVIDAQRDHAETRRPDAPVSRFDYIETDAESERTEVQAFMMFCGSSAYLRFSVLIYHSQKHLDVKRFGDIVAGTKIY